MEFAGGSLKLKGEKIKKKQKKKEKPIISKPQIESSKRQKTAAEIKFHEAQKKRMDSKLENYALKSHKDRVAEFNTYLERLTEHNDLPKIGPG